MQVALPDESKVPERWVRWLGAVTSLALASVLFGCAGCSRSPAATRAPDVPYEPSPPEVVAAMLQLAAVGPEDVVYDLGCGDGRVVIAAARDRGARAVCIDIDPQRIRESRENAARAGVLHRIAFRTQDLFEADVAEANVVMLFLWPEVNLRLRSKLQAELPPGSRIVSHWHDMGSWKADETIRLRPDGKERPVYLWRIGERAAAP